MGRARGLGPARAQAASAALCDFLWPESGPGGRPLADRGEEKLTMDVMKIVRDHGVIPVLGLKNPDTAEALAAALIQGGLPLIEVTLRSEGALECLRRIKKAYPEMAVGAGTVLSVEQLNAAAQAGADYVVAPGFNKKVVARAQELGLPIVAGCVTPTEIEAGLEMGLTTFKYFPCEALGGMEAIKQLCGPYRNIQFIPTGGINFGNMGDYLKSEHIAAVGGSCMAPAAMVEAEDWEGITALCRKAVKISLGFELAHVGINGESEQEGLDTANWFADRFGFGVKLGNSSNFADTAVECCKKEFPGQHGHIGFSTLSPERAVAWFEAKGIPLREETRKVDAAGRLISIYLKEEIGGFAVHIMKKK